MTDEEKKAINIIKDLGINIYNGKSQIISGTVTKEISIAIYTILNLIQKQEKVIDEMTIYINNNIDVISKDIEGSICCHNIDGKCINRKCVECVKKYFYRKVKKMSEEEIIENIKKQIENTKKANECGLSNNDFQEDIQALERNFRFI